MSQRVASEGAREEVLFVGAFPPPNTGQTLATERFYRLAAEAVALDRVNLVDPRRHERAPGGFTWRRVGDLLRLALRLRRRLKAAPVGVLYMTPSASTMGHLRDRAVVWAARPYVGRIVGHIHNGNWAELFDGPLARSARRLVGAVDTFAFLSPSLEARAEGHVPDAKRAVVPNTIGEDLHFTEAEVASKIADRTAREHLEIVFISNMIPSKGYAVLGEALGLLKERGIPFEAHFVGGWPGAEPREAFEHRLRGLGIADEVRVHGPVVERPAIRDFFRQADAFVLPTTYPHEAQPLSVIEALNAATPVVSTRHASIPDMLTDGEGGLLVAADAVALADALERLADVAVWARMARGARRDFDSRFREEAVQSVFVSTLLGVPVDA